MASTEQKVIINGRRFIVHHGETTAARILTWKEAENYEPRRYVDLTMSR